MRTNNMTAKDCKKNIKLNIHLRNISANENERKNEGRMKRWLPPDFLCNM